MKKSLLMLAGVLAVGSVALAAPPAIPSTPAAVDGLVYARTVTLESGFTYVWNAEKPTVTTATLLVLRVDPDLVFPRQVAEPVLYVGDHTAQRINAGHQSGHVVALVPGEVDLATAPIWFGTPDFPHRVDVAMAKAERSLAGQAGIKPFSPEKVEAAVTRSGERLNAVDMKELLRTEVAELILEYSPQESHLAEGFRVPVLSRKKDSPQDSEN